jgi:hypothetical protein
MGVSYVRGAIGLSLLGVVAIAPPTLAAQGEPQCTVKLELTKLRTRAGCWIDAPKRGATGVARFTCRGGATKVTLGPHTFTGTVKKGVLSTQATSEFEFSDGCVWRTRQSVEGKLGSGSLTYTYSERVVKSDGSCASPCAARGTVDVED